jgi:hypothetical protein
VGGEGRGGVRENDKNSTNNDNIRTSTLYSLTFDVVSSAKSDNVDKKLKSSGKSDPPSPSPPAYTRHLTTMLISNKRFVHVSSNQHATMLQYCSTLSVNARRQRDHNSVRPTADRHFSWLRLRTSHTQSSNVTIVNKTGRNQSTKRSQLSNFQPPQPSHPAKYDTMAKLHINHHPNTHTGWKSTLLTSLGLSLFCFGLV